MVAISAVLPTIMVSTSTIASGAPAFVCTAASNAGSLLGSPVLGDQLCGVDGERFRPDDHARAEIRHALDIPGEAVVFLFLGSVRSVLVPVMAIPISLIGVCFILFAMDYSINLLSLLAMVALLWTQRRKKNFVRREF